MRRCLHALDPAVKFDEVDFEVGFRKIDVDNDGYISFEDVLANIEEQQPYTETPPQWFLDFRNNY